MSDELSNLGVGALGRLGFGASSAKLRYQNDIAAFAREVLHVDTADYQDDIFDALLKYHRVAVRGPHGLGKTAVAASVVLWAESVFETDVKVLTTASAWRQLIHFTWPEIHKWAAKASWEKVGVQIREGVELLTLMISVGNRQAFAAASDDPSSMEGAHATIIVVVFDEAKGIPVDIWDALEGAFSTGIVYALAISTPGVASGRFYDLFSNRAKYPDWHVIHVTLEMAIKAGRISREWAEKRKKQWGEKSAVYLNRVLGDFASTEESSVVPLAWVEQANERWLLCEGKGEGERVKGVDPAYKGEDMTTVAVMVGRVVESLDSYSKEDTMQTSGRIAGTTHKTTRVAIDIIGVGAGVYDRLRELGYNVTGVNVSASTDMVDKTGLGGFMNLRSGLWWALREALDPSNPDAIALPYNDKLIGDLTAPTWKYHSRGQIQVESKDDLRLRLGRSTDSADAVALAIYLTLNQGWTEEQIENYGKGKLNLEGVPDFELELARQAGVIK